MVDLARKEDHEQGESYTNAYTTYAEQHSEDGDSIEHRRANGREGKATYNLLPEIARPLTFEIELSLVKRIYFGNDDSPKDDLFPPVERIFHIQVAESFHPRLNIFEVNLR